MQAKISRLRGDSQEQPHVAAESQECHTFHELRLYVEGVLYVF